MDAVILDELGNIAAVLGFAGTAWVMLWLRDRWSARVVDEVTRRDLNALLRRSRAFNVDDQIAWLTATSDGDPASDGGSAASMTSKR